jgi:hypothetical protein
MAINPLGLVAALTAFASIWLGHVSVRKIEAQAVHLWKPVLLFVALGITLEIASLMVPQRALAVAFGILGITLLWDALELKRQEKRIWKGHAPANPRNPRHAAMLAGANASATTRDVLKREPLGRPLTPGEASHQG